MRIVLGETNDIFLPLANMTGSTADHLIAVRAVQVCPWTPGNWMPDFSLEIILHNSATLPS